MLSHKIKSRLDATMIILVGSLFYYINDARSHKHQICVISLHISARDRFMCTLIEVLHLQAVYC